MAKILIVEDDSTKVCLIIAACNDRRNKIQHEFLVTPELKRAEEALQNGTFDLAIMDHNVKGGTTIDLIRETKIKFPNMILIAASTEPFNRVLQINAGCSVEIHDTTPPAFIRNTIAQAKFGI